MYKAIWTLIKSMAGETRQQLSSPNGRKVYGDVPNDSSDIVLTILYKGIMSDPYSHYRIGKIIDLLEISRQFSPGECLCCSWGHFEYDGDDGSIIQSKNTQWEKLWTLLKEKGINVEQIKNLLSERRKEIQKSNRDECNTYNQYEILKEIAKQMGINLN